MTGDTARLTRLAVAQLDEGGPGYTIENPFGQTIHVMPRPPAFRATVVFEWEGAMPDDVRDLVARARAAGLMAAG
ncbi:MAG: hypothetical protein ABW194_09755 [Novosphingobium sp.]